MIFWKHKTTPMIKAWKHDADVFGLPENIQKGLIFLIAMAMSADAQNGDLEKFITSARKLSSKIRVKGPHIAQDAAGDFYDGKIEWLLAELAARFLKGFKPRQIEMSRSNVVQVWNRSPQDLLPTCLSPETSLMSEWDEISISLCRQIGENINDDLEGAFLDGFYFFDSHAPADMVATLQISKLATSLLPPHLSWFMHCLNFTPKLLGQGNPVQKVLNCFIGPPDDVIYPLLMQFSDLLHYSGPGIKRQEVWDANLPVYAVQAGVMQIGLDESVSEPWFLATGEKLKHDGYTPPPVCQSRDQIVSVLRSQMLSKWGYDLMIEPQSCSPGSHYTRRACISMLCVANVFLCPEWNKFAAKGKK